MLSTNFRRNAIGAIGDATGKRKVQKPSDIPGLRRKKAKKVSLRQNGVFIVDLQSSRSARTPKRKSAKKVEFHNSLFNTVHQMQCATVHPFNFIHHFCQCSKIFKLSKGIISSAR